MPESVAAIGSIAACSVTYRSRSAYRASSVSAPVSVTVLLRDE